MAFPLEGVRILSVEQYAAGPFGTLALADLGAEIIRIENPADGGDIGRRVRLAGEASGEGMSLFHQTFNRNKQSITLDLKHPRGREILHRLVARADAVFNNLRGDLPESLGLDYQALGAVKPEIVCVHLSAYGRENERAGWPGYDYLMQAECGWLSVTGEPGGEPQRMGLSLVDFSAGLQGAVAILAGIIGARTSGRGGDLDVSLFGAAITSLAYVATWYLSAGVETGRHPRSAHPSLTPSQLFRTRDGWIFIMCNKEKFWPRLCAAIGEPALADDPDYAGFAERLRHRDRLTGILDEALLRRTTNEWMSVFSGEVPAAPVHDIKGALDSPFARESGYILACGTSSGTPVTAPGPAVRVAGSRSLTEPAPDLARDLESVMAEIGIEGEELAALRKAGVC